jgi:site-specific recombinase XerD
MATIKLIVKSDEKGQPATIYLRLRDYKTDIIIPTSEKVFPEYWNNKSQSFKQRILHSEEFTEDDKVNIEDKFQKLKDFILKELYNLNGEEISKDWLKTVVNKFYNKKEPGSETLIQYIRRFIVEATNGTRLIEDDNSRYRASTIKNYLSFEVQFLEFCGMYSDKTKERLTKEGKPLRRVKVLNFKDITLDFYKDFMRFFNEKNYSPNTIGRHIKHLKVIMRQSEDEGLHTNTEFQRKSFKATSEKVENVYLNEQELKKIFELDLSNEKNLEIIRDVFLCGCYTAQRYSDYCRISKEHVKEYSGRKVIQIIQQKTGEQCIIPIRPELEKILKKYDYTLPRTHEQKVNEHIKDIAKLAEITETISYEEKKGGLTVKKLVQKNELIKTHTARRSGCTNMYLAGIPTIDIMKISGHKTEREFLKYIKVTNEETAVSLSNHPFFIGNNLSIAK